MHLPIHTDPNLQPWLPLSGLHLHRTTSVVKFIWESFQNISCLTLDSWVPVRISVGDPCHFGPRIRTSDLRIRMQIREAPKNIQILWIRIRNTGTFTLFFNDKKSSIRYVQNSRNQDFSYYFCLMIVGSAAGSGSVPHTNGAGYGSRRP
jgi:hypothetical protein